MTDRDHTTSISLPLFGPCLLWEIDFFFSAGKGGWLLCLTDCVVAGRKEGGFVTTVVAGWGQAGYRSQGEDCFMFLSTAVYPNVSYSVGRCTVCALERGGGENSIYMKLGLI